MATHLQAGRVGAYTVRVVDDPGRQPQHAVLDRAQRLVVPAASRRGGGDGHAAGPSILARCEMQRLAARSPAFR
jgi:hypothetical protein